jgi:hypothetical protein
MSRRDDDGPEFCRELIKNSRNPSDINHPHIHISGVCPMRKYLQQVDYATQSLTHLHILQPKRHTTEK